ncbi:MAG TPA: TlyA family RNA methyltransferase [Propionibacteriaceae bacterium]|nr:TlyA family RNA methyltransferase [Propionibacteriaceae bacterium]
MRLDQALVSRGLARSRQHASELIRSGLVTVDGVVTSKPATSVGDAAAVDAPADAYVSRAAHKLLGALEDSHTPVQGRALDAGASTGGFTQVLLEAGATRVYAVDVGHDQLVGSLRRDPRVVVHEGTNLRDLTLQHVENEPVDLVVADVSFISLRLLLEPMLGVLRPEGVALLMVKPQFEVGRERLGGGGVVRDEKDRTAAVDGVAETARALGWTEDWRGVSRLPGPAGNVELFLRLRRTGH